MPQAIITEAMIAAARSTGAAKRLTFDETRRILAAALSKMEFAQHGAQYPLLVSNTIETKRARFIGATERRCWFRVQAEDGQELVVHANDIQPSRGI